MLIYHNFTKGDRCCRWKKNIGKENVILYSKEAIILNNSIRAQSLPTIVHLDLLMERMGMAMSSMKKVNR